MEWLSVHAGSLVHLLGRINILPFFPIAISIVVIIGVSRGEELIELIQKRTAKESATVEKFQTGGAAVREFCSFLTKEECRRWVTITDSKRIP